MNRRLITTALFFLVVFTLFHLSLASGATTEVHIVKYAADGYTVLKEKRVDYHWMEENLPVIGDGTTRYYHQGPVFVDDPEERWNPAEDANVQEKDMGAVKGTNLKDLCDLVGGMEDGDYVVIRAMDGLKRPFAYKNVYNYGLREGPIVVTWYVDGLSMYPPASYPDTGYTDGMRLVWLADTSTNPWGIHAFGNWDWHENADEEYWYYYYGSPTEKYPTTTGLSVKYVSDILIYSQEEPLGSIGVTSQPAGAIVVLDGMETDYATPCVIPDLEIGSYAVTARKDGYIEPYEEWVEVVHDTQSDIHFTLIREDYSGDELYFESDEADAESEETGRYTLLPVLDMQGRLHLLIPDEEDADEFEISVPAESIYGRFFVFCARDCTGDSCLEIVPFKLDAGGTPLDPEASQIFSGDAEGLQAATFCYDISGLTEGVKSLHMKMPDQRDDLCGRTATAVIIVEEVPESPERSVIIGEAADIPVTREKSLWPGQETVAEFRPGSDLSGAKSALLYIVSTFPKDTEDAMYRVTACDRVFTGEFNQSENGIGTAIVDVTPALSGETLLVGIGGEEKSGGEFSHENRVAILVVEWEEDLPTPMVTPTTKEFIPDSAIISLQAKSTPKTPVPTRIVEAIPQESGWAESVTQFIGDLFWHILSLFDPALGDKSDYLPGVDNPSHPANAAGMKPQEVVVTVLSEPQGADVSVDGDFITITPCRLGMTTGEVYDILLELEGYEPYQLDMRPEADRFLNVTLSRPPGEIETESEPQETAPETRMRYGGVYVTSYPGDLELRVDGKDLGLKTPAVVYGLKEGFHSVEVRRYREGVSVPEAMRSRVWVYRGTTTMVGFDLAGVNLARRIRVISEDEEEIQFTVDGRYPVMRTPVEIDTSGTDLFVTSVGDESYISYCIPDALQSGSSFEIGEYEGTLHTLDVTSEPGGAEIFLDGIRTGLYTPSRISNLSFGYHRLTVTLPGHLPGEKILSIPQDGDTRVDGTEKFLLETYPSGSLTIESEPSGARIYLDGISTGEQTPCTFDDLTLGIHEVKLVSGTESRSVDAIVEPKRPRRYFIDLT